MPATLVFILWWWKRKKGNALSPFNLHISSAVVYIHLHKHLYAIMCPLIVVLVLTFEIVNKSVLCVGTKKAKFHINKL